MQGGRLRSSEERLQEMELWVDVVTGRHSAGARRAAKRADLVNASTARSFPKQGPHQVSDDGGLRGSSSGMPASTLPTRSAPTSAALV